MSFLTYREKEERAYPSSDGKPFAENDITRDYMIYAVEGLRLYFQKRSNVYVSSNSFIYYEEGNKKAVVAPDVYVVFGVPKRLRDKYKVWQEGGITPQFVLEVTSKITQKKDQEVKPKIYQKLGVREYFHYDPSGDCLNPILQGMRLVNDRYEPIAANNISFDTLWLYSEVLGLELRVTSGEFRFRVPQTGEFLKTREEAQKARLAAESAFQQSEAARQLKQEARLTAQSSFQESKQARLAAESAFQQSEQARLAQQQARLAAESALRSLISQLLNSGMNLAQVAQMANLPISEVQRLIGRNE